MMHRSEDELTLDPSWTICDCSVTSDKEYKVGDLPQTPTEPAEDEEDGSDCFMFTTFYRVRDTSTSSLMSYGNLQLVYESTEPVHVDFYSSALGWAEIKNKTGDLVAVLKREAWDLFTRRHTK